MKFCILFSYVCIVNATYAQTKQVCGPISESNKKIKMENQFKKGEKNVLGTDLKIASTKPLTGFYRDGFCSTGKDDHGTHVVAAVVTEEFLQYSKTKGNDLITPNLAYGFAGLKPGDTWCLCAARWKEAYEAGVAPPVVMEATHSKALEFVTMKQLESSLKKP